MKAYKGFNPDMTCRGFKYEEGKTYEMPAEKEVVEEPRQWIAFKVNLTISEARELAAWLKDRGIEYGRA